METPSFINYANSFAHHVFCPPANAQWNIVDQSTQSSTETDRSVDGAQDELTRLTALTVDFPEFPLPSNNGGDDAASAAATPADTDTPHNHQIPLINHAAPESGKRSRNNFIDLIGLFSIHSLAHICG
jgi:hypothetical protein